MSSLEVAWEAAGVLFYDHLAAMQETRPQKVHAVVENSCCLAANTQVKAVWSCHQLQPEYLPSCFGWGSGQAYEG